MEKAVSHHENIKAILENIQSPEKLNGHPWADSISVQDALKRIPALNEQPQGARLLRVITDLFRTMLPNTPPVRGKRLDTRWGRFGILAAYYFAPLKYARPFPPSMRDAWRWIDTAILLFVYNQAIETITPEQAEPYRLIGGQIDMPANSTISDWHREGVNILLDLYLAQERLLTQEHEAKLTIEMEHAKPPPSTPKRHPRSWPVILLILLAIVILSFGVQKGIRIYTLTQAVRSDINELENIDPSLLGVGDSDKIGTLLHRARLDVSSLHKEVRPFFWFTSKMGWIPVYGGDIKHAGELLQIADSTLSAADISFTASRPLLNALGDEDTPLKLSDLTVMLIDLKPALLEAKAYSDSALSAKQEINLTELSPQTQKLLGKIDPYLGLMNEALSVSLSLPELLGAAGNGPKTYLILIQNEDELRPTGGFITSVGKVVVFSGEIMNWSVEDSYAIDDPSKTYPRAPWQMQSFMNIPALVFRDANWYADFPTAATWAEYLYAYTNSSVDGVIAIDQQVLVNLLAVTGPIQVNELGITVTSENIFETMRTLKAPEVQEEAEGWDRKKFIKPIASAIMDQLLSGEDLSWTQLSKTMLSLLEQHHILIQIDEPAFAAVLANRGWDGALFRVEGDYLMVVDTNVGYNKTNAVVTRTLDYDIDLTDLAAPKSSLVVFYKNNASDVIGTGCVQTAELPIAAPEYWYPINRCYFNYLRVYVPDGTSLLDATPHGVTRSDMVMLDQDVPPRVDVLNEGVHDIQGFGTLMVIPEQQSLSTSFHFQLSNDVLNQYDKSGLLIYKLHIQKQAGTLSTPITVRLHLPNAAKIASFSPPGGLLDGDNLLFNLTLIKDIDLEIVFFP